MEQNSTEWLAMRGKKIGASDSNIIMGESKFKTVRQLWTEKMEYMINGNIKEDENSGNFITDKGHRIEPKIRSLMELEYDVELPATIVTCEDENFDFMMASLDGFGKSEASNLTYVLECKYVGQDDFLKVKSGLILEQYKPQIMHQLFLTKADFCILAVATEDKVNLNENGKPKLKFTHVLVKIDDEYIKKELLPKLVWFWNCVLDCEDVGLSYDDVLTDNSEELSDALTRYKALIDEQEELEERVSKLKKEIFKMAKHDKVECNGIKVYRVKTKGSSSIEIDYESYVKDNNIAIPDTYQKVKERKGSVSEQIKFPKEETEEKPKRKKKGE